MLEVDNFVIETGIDDLVLNMITIFMEFRKDKEWGFTDCTSFIVMKEKNIIEAFSIDHHFEQAGFKILLK